MSTTTKLQLLRVRDLRERLGVSRGTIYAWIESGLLPKPIKLSPKTVVWREQDIERLVRTRQKNPLPAVSGGDMRTPEGKAALAARVAERKKAVPSTKSK